MNSVLAPPYKCLAACVAAALVACASDWSPTEQLSVRHQAVIYASDGRLDVEAEPDPGVRGLAEASVALISADQLALVDNSVTVLSANLGERLDLCEGERFAEQPSVAACSGVLVGDDLVLTAGHCFLEGQSCERYAYVFDFRVDASGQLLLAPEDVFGCRSVVAHKHARAGSPSVLDYALIQLDRKTNRTPVSVEVSRPLLGTPVTLLGYPSGLPAKIDTGGTVIDASEGSNIISVSADAFGGNSGSPVFDADLLLRGLLVEGIAADYYFDEGDGCTRAAQLPAPPPGGSGEAVLLMDPVLASICEAGSPSEQLCGITPECGDGVCATSEVDNCSECGLPRCAGFDCAIESSRVEQADDTGGLAALAAVRPSMQPNEGGCTVTSVRSFDGHSVLGMLIAVMLFAAGRGLIHSNRKVT